MMTCYFLLRLLGKLREAQGGETTGDCCLLVDTKWSSKGEEKKITHFQLVSKHSRVLKAALRFILFIF